MSTVFCGDIQIPDGRKIWVWYELDPPDYATLELTWKGDDELTPEEYEMDIDIGNGQIVKLHEYAVVQIKPSRRTIINDT